MLINNVPDEEVDRLVEFAEGLQDRYCSIEEEYNAEFEDMNFLELTKHQLSIIEQTSFECESCGWWKSCDYKENYNGEYICESCYEEKIAEDEELNQEEDEDVEF